MLGFPSNQLLPVGYAAGGMYHIPPSPMGNIAQLNKAGYSNPIGSMLHSPYYSNNYNYISPITWANRQKALEDARREQVRKERDTLKDISRRVHRSLKDMDEEAIEEHVKYYDIVERNEKLETTIKEVADYVRLSKLVPAPLDTRMVAYINYVHNSYKEKYPDDMSLAQFLEVGGELYRDSLFEIRERESMNGQLKYNSAAFNNIVDMHRTSSSYFNRSLLNGGSIDVGNLEIQLPDIRTGEKSRITTNTLSMQQEYAEKRRLFIQACLSKGGA